MSAGSLIDELGAAPRAGETWTFRWTSGDERPLDDRGRRSVGYELRLELR